MRIFLIFFCFIAFSLDGFSQDIPTRLDLNQCIAIAIKNNLNVQRSAIQSENAKIGWQQARENLLPTLNGGITHGLNQGRSIDPLTNTYINHEIAYASPYLSGSLMLFNGLAMQNLIKQNSLLYQAAKQEEQQAKDDLTLNVILAYLQVLTNQDLFTFSQTQKETTAKQLERLEALNQNGAVSPGDYYNLKGEYANDQLSVINAGNSLENSKITLVGLLNIPYSKDLQLAPLPADQFALTYDAGPEEVYHAALQNFAAVKAADLREKSSDVQLKTSRSGYFPSIHFGAGLSSSFSNAARDAQNRHIAYFDQFGNNLSRSFSIGISIPFLNSFRTKNSIALAKLNRRESALVAQNTRTELQHLTEQAYLNMAASRERYITLQQQAAAYAESFRTVEIRFNSGVINSVDYLIAKNNLDRANINMLSNKYDFILRKKILDFYRSETNP